MFRDPKMKGSYSKDFAYGYSIFKSTGKGLLDVSKLLRKTKDRGSPNNKFPVR